MSSSTTEAHPVSQYAVDIGLSLTAPGGPRHQDDDLLTSSNGGDSSDDEMSADECDDNDQLQSVRRLRKPRSSLKSFSDLLEHCRRHRLRISKTVGQWSFSNFTLAQHSMAGCTRVYSLGRIGDSTENSILCVDLNDVTDDDVMQGTNPEVKAERVLYWKLLKEPEKNTDVQASMSKEEELLRQRLRLLVGGISSYTYHEATSTFLFSSGGQLYTLVDSDCFEHPSLEKVDQPKLQTGTPMDAQFCPVNPSLISCVINGDLYLQYGSHLQRLTFSGDEKNKAKTVGVASYIIQEEFDRYTGYWWCPVVIDNKYYLMYEENDASRVESLSINCPAELSDNVEIMRYPKPGKPNVKWDIKMLEIVVCSSTPQPKLAINTTILSCAYDLRELFPWAEYIIRAGWVPDGSGAWLQLISRLQRKLAIVFVPLRFFIPQNSQMCFSNGPVSASPVVVLYEEETPDLLIKDHNYFVLLDQSIHSKQFLWCSSKTGFSHLYVVVSCPIDEFSTSIGGQKLGHISFYRNREWALTSGAWEVCRKAEPYVDTERKLIFFLGSKDTPIESHVYCVSYANKESGSLYVQRLTELGFCYGAARDSKPFRISSCGNFLITTRSSFSTVGQYLVYGLCYKASIGCQTEVSGKSGLPRAQLLYTLCPGSPEVPLQSDYEKQIYKSADGTTQEEAECPPEIIMYQSITSGFLHYACLWRPVNFKPHRIYPTILSVYAGPEVQLIKNCYLGCTNVAKYTSLGYAVVMIDGRGSANRGLAFEKAIWGEMGTVELDDQVEGLRYINDVAKCLDLTRVAIIGWSYGGYAALMGLAKKGDVFKVAVAGAPVTSWSCYDTGYTERFMGMPLEPHQQELQAANTPLNRYEASSVLHYVRQLPDEPGRLLLLHGLMDENVHFYHTALLIDSMLKDGKPYQLQVYPQERHAVRNFDTVVHMEATILDFLQRHL